MKRIVREQVLAYEQWESARPILRPLFIVEKERRRLHVGEHVTLLFENAQSVWYQVEEMLRVERMTDPAAIQHEIDTYNALVPGAGELSATLLIEYADAAERDVALRKLLGFEKHLWLRIGERRVQAEFDASQVGEDAVSSVQFIRFAVGGRTGERFTELAAAGAVAVEVDHPELTVSAPVAGDLARALAEDLRDLGVILAVRIALAIGFAVDAGVAVLALFAQGLLEPLLDIPVRDAALTSIVGGEFAVVSCVYALAFRDPGRWRVLLWICALDQLAAVVLPALAIAHGQIPATFKTVGPIPLQAVMAITLALGARAGNERRPA